MLSLALAATGALVWLAPDDEVAPVRAGARQPRTSEPAHSTPTNRPLRADHAAGTFAPVSLRQAPRQVVTDNVPDLFKSATWYVAPPPVAVVAVKPPAPPPPTAPALPFTFLGQYVEDQRQQIILARGDRVVTAVVGDAIDKNYRLESLQNGLLTFVYLPLDARQTLTIGTTQ
jgi:hypothetical protein